MKKGIEKQTKSFTFTYFASEEELYNDVFKISDYLNTNCSYYIFGKEVCPTTGKIHLQGYAQLHRKTRIRTIRTAMNCHCEIPLKDALININYCKKDNKFTEFGQVRLPKHGNPEEKTERSKEILELAKKGNLDQIQDSYPSNFLHSYRTIKSIAAEESKPYKCLERIGVWIYSQASGTGKSRFVSSNWDDAHWTLGDQWMDGYTGQREIVYDDIDCTNSITLLRTLKRVCDVHPVRMGVKGSSVSLKHRTTIVTSNYTPFELYNPVDASAINRRFIMVTALGWDKANNDLMVRHENTPNGKTWLLKNFLLNYDLF